MSLDDDIRAAERVKDEVLVRRLRRRRGDGKYLVGDLVKFWAAGKDNPCEIADVYPGGDCGYIVCKNKDGGLRFGYQVSFSKLELFEE